jgi:cystathionine beta-synthase
MHMRSVLLVLVDGHRSPRLEANAKRVLCAPGSDVGEDGEPSPELVAWARQHAAVISVAGTGADRVVTKFSEHGLIARRVDDGEPTVATAGMRIVDNVLELVGDTPLVRLDRLFPDSRALVLGKLEAANPGGSTKDRVAVSLVDAAERDGLLLPGGMIVEPTSGNTGVGLAIVAARRGYRCTFTVPDKVSAEKIALLRAYGAEVVVCPTNVEADDPRSYYSVAREIAKADPSAFHPDQYANPANPAAHFSGTGPEIWSQTDGKVTHFVAGAGTGGTLGGIGRYLKAQNPAIRIVAADPVGSVYSGGGAEPYLVEGIGEDFWPGNWDGGIVDEIVPVSDADSFAWVRRAAQQEGILVGSSCGAALACAAHVAAEAREGDVIVVLLPDGGRGYLSKVYDDSWMRIHGFIDESAGGRKLRDVVSALGNKRPLFPHVHPHETVRTVAGIMAEYAVEELPVLVVEGPSVPSQVVGSIDVTTVAAALGHPHELVGRGGTPLPFAGVGENVTTVVARMGSRRGVVVNDRGRPIALLTFSDILAG